MISASGSDNSSAAPAVVMPKVPVTTDTKGRVRVRLAKLEITASSPGIHLAPYAATQTVIISNLLSNEMYDLVVFSVGGMANEGGAFSGAVSGWTRGYPVAGVAPTDFLLETNYVENPFARTDAHGTLTFTIKPNATVMPGGYNNGDFNGLQLMEGVHALHATSNRKVSEN